MTDSCYEIIPMLGRYASHAVMSDGELARVRMHLLECDVCRSQAVPDGKKRLDELWPSERVPAAEVVPSRGLLTVSMVVSLVVHLGLVLAAIAGFDALSERWEGSVFTARSQPFSGALVQAHLPVDLSASILYGDPNLPGTMPMVQPPGSTTDSASHANGATLVQIGRTRDYDDLPLVSVGIDTRIFQTGNFIEPEGADAPYRGNPLDTNPLDAIVYGAGPTKHHLVIWLIDRTSSMHARWPTVGKQIMQWSDELAANVSNRVMMTVVVFGKKPEKALLGETKNPVDVIDTFLLYDPDESETENIGRALSYCLQVPTGGRNCSIVLMTDERGDDLTDAVLAKLRAEMVRDRVKLYLICDELPIGLPSVEKTIGGKTITLNVGYESARAEMVSDWGQAIPVLTPGRVTSGFGPYELSFLAVESKGMVFLNSVSEENNLDDLDARKPSLALRSDYWLENKDRPLRRVVLDGVAALGGAPFPNRVTIRDEAARQDELQRSHASLALVRRWQPTVERAVADHLQNEKSTRWRAHARLLMAQLAAADYYLSMRVELLAGAKLVEGQVLTFSLEPATRLGGSRVTLLAERLSGNGATPWTTVGHRLGDLKVLRLVAE